MKKYLKLMFLTATLCMAMSVVIPTPTIEAENTTTEETTTSDFTPFSNKDIPPIGP